MEKEPTEAIMTKEKMIAALNDDLANEYGAIVQYLVYAAKATGPYRPQLVAFYEAEIPDETAHAKYLANKIVALGGQPTGAVPPLAEASTNKEMLERVRDAEALAVKNYAERAEQAEALGDKGLQVQLEDMVRDETEHLEETERILREWPL
jgi:bacterioferritin